MENFYITLIRNGRMTKDKAIQQIVSNINHYGKMLSDVKHDGTFRYQQILSYTGELKRHVSDFKEVSDYQPETKQQQ